MQGNITILLKALNVLTVTIYPLTPAAIRMPAEEVKIESRRLTAVTTEGSCKNVSPN